MDATAAQREAFEALLHPHLPALWRVIRRLVREPADAEDLLQEACLKAFRGRHLFQPGTDVKAWLLTILLAVVLVFWRAPAVPVVVHELVESQIRSHLMGTSYQALPANATAIRGWFVDKVEFPVLVPILPPEHYAFLGARVNYFLDRRVVEMAYTAGEHTVTFVMFADQGITLSAQSTLQLGRRTLYIDTHKGYTTVLWRDRSAVCGLVSDLSRTALVETLRRVMPPMAESSGDFSTRMSLLKLSYRIDQNVILRQCRMSR